jgi:hypothetical protein
MGVIDGGIGRNFMVNSPFSTGVLMPNGVGAHYSGSGGGGGQGHVERLASALSRSDLASEPSSSSSQGMALIVLLCIRKVDFDNLQ